MDQFIVVCCSEGQVSMFKRSSEAESCRKAAELAQKVGDEVIVARIVHRYEVSTCSQS